MCLPTYTNCVFMSSANCVFLRAASQMNRRIPSLPAQTASHGHRCWIVYTGWLWRVELEQLWLPRRGGRRFHPLKTEQCGHVGAGIIRVAGAGILQLPAIIEADGQVMSDRVP